MEATAAPRASSASTSRLSGRRWWGRQRPAPNAPLDPTTRLSAVKRAVVWLKTLAANVDRSRTFGLAAEMTCWLFLALIPLAAVLGMIAAKLAMKNYEAASGIMRAMPSSMRQMIGGELGRVSAWNGGAVAPLAALTFIWLASSGLHAVFDGLEVATESCQRPWWKKRLYALASCIALSIGVALLTLLGTGLDWIRHIAGAGIPDVFAGHGVVAGTLRLMTAAALAFGLIVFLYWAGVTRRMRSRMPRAPGAAIAVLLMGVLGWGYGFWVSKAGNGSAYQAGLAVIGVTIMTLYLFCSALLLGAEINRVLGARRVLKFSVHPAVAPPPAVTESMMTCDGVLNVRKGHVTRIARGYFRPSRLPNPPRASLG